MHYTIDKRRQIRSWSTQPKDGQASYLECAKNQPNKMN